MVTVITLLILLGRSIQVVKAVKLFLEKYGSARLVRFSNAKDQYICSY